MKHLLVFVLALLVFGGCRSAQWATKKIAKVEASQPFVLTSYCANKYPSVVYDSTRIVYKPGAPVISNDTFIVRDTINKMTYKYITKVANTRDTIITTQIRQVENKARVETLTMERDKLRTEQAVLGNKFHSVRKWIYILAAVSFIMICWKIANWLKWLPI